MKTPRCLPSPLPVSLPPHCGGLRMLPSSSPFRLWIAKNAARFSPSAPCRLRIQATRKIGCGATEGQTENKGRGKASKEKSLGLGDLQKHYLFLTWEENSCALTGDSL